MTASQVLPVHLVRQAPQALEARQEPLVPQGPPVLQERPALLDLLDMLLSLT